MSISEYDPFELAIMQQPYAYFAALQEQAPCHYVAKRDVYVITRYDDVRAALFDSARFSSKPGNPSTFRAFTPTRRTHRAEGHSGAHDEPLVTRISSPNCRTPSCLLMRDVERSRSTTFHA